VRFGNATEESMRRLKDALDFLWRYTGDIFYTEPEEKALEAEGKLICFDSVKTEWLQDIKELFQKSGLTIPENTYMLIGGRKGVHTELLSYILNEMQMLPRMYPDAKW
jgi:ring-1,2-phenylacetyl-CoA epoxidase subunit PaaC